MIDLSERFDVNKSKDSSECLICHYWYFGNGFKFWRSICNGCHDILMASLGINNIVIITGKGLVTVV